eukprot:jgi/Psemu1/60266/gm1.60266_g
MRTYTEYFEATVSPFGSLPSERNLLNLFKAQAVGGLGIFVTDALGEPRLRLIIDLRKEAGELVLVNADMLSQTTASQVLSLGHHIAELDAHLQRPSIPAVPEGAPHSEMIQAHKAFFIRFELVPFLLAKSWGTSGDLRPLFDTLRVAGTVPTAPAGDPTLLQPGPSFWSEPGLTQLHEEQGDLRLSEGLDQKRAQSIGATWGPLYTQRLLLLCGKQEEANLPPIYQAWAQKSKHKKTHMIFQSQVAARVSE